MNYAPFIVLEAEVTFFAEDPDGNPSDEIYVGGCVERLPLERSYTEKLLAFAGEDYRRVWHEDEENTIELENGWLNQLGVLDANRQASGQMPSFLRNQRLFLVVIWYDEETTAWCKRTYFGVTARRQRVPGDASQSTTFRAERMQEIAGLGERPEATVSEAGTVSYVNGALRLDLYRFAAGIFTPLRSDLATLATITAGVDSLEIKFGSTMALSVEEEVGVTVKRLLASGGTFVDETGPRIEFSMGGRRIASLTATGTLAVSNITEQDALPADDGSGFVLQGETWQCAFLPVGATAVGWQEAA